MRVVMKIEMSWQVNEEVSRDMTGEADGKNQEVDSRDGVMHIWMSDLWHYPVLLLTLNSDPRGGILCDGEPLPTAVDGRSGIDRRSFSTAMVVFDIQGGQKMRPLSWVALVFKTPRLICAIFDTLQDRFFRTHVSTSFSSIMQNEVFHLNTFDFKSNYSATSNNTKLVHWPLMGGGCYI